jgi:hypothetical protein
MNPVFVMKSEPKKLVKIYLYFVSFADPNDPYEIASRSRIYKF